MKLKNWLIGLLGINIVIAVHEAGHWTMAHLFGVETPEFSIGFGPKLLTKKIGTTDFVLAALPLGGFVEIEGMRHAEPGKEAVSFVTQPFKHKVLILLGGILFNILFAFLVFVRVGFPPLVLPRPREEIEPPTPQHQRRAFVGPLGIIRMASQSWMYGAQVYFYFLAILSLNLAIFNLFPLPILDGGQLLLIAVEAIRGSALPDVTYQIIMGITILLMLFLLLQVTRQDLRNS